MRLTDGLVKALKEVAHALSLDVSHLEIRIAPVPSYMTKSEQAKVSIVYGTKLIAVFSLVCLPGCCGIVVSTGSAIIKAYRNKGIGKILAKARITLAREYGYSMMICTDVSENEPQQKILKGLEWTEVVEFVNDRTGNKIKLHYIKL